MPLVTRSVTDDLISMKKYDSMYSYEKTVGKDPETVFGELFSKLKDAGYIVLSFVDVKEIIKKNYNEDFPFYSIMNVCKPQAAKELITLSEELGLFLPCKIVVTGNENNTRIMMLRVSEMARVHLKLSGEEAEKYEEELIEVLNGI